MLKSPTTRQQKLQFVNCIVGCHDLMCKCNEPAFHSLRILLDQLKPELSPKNIEQLQKCLGDVPGTAGEGEDGGFGPGDLEKLFSVDEDEEDGDNR